MSQSDSSHLPHRPYGPDLVPISVIGMGGITVVDMPRDRMERLVRRAIARGVNYFDTAPTYGDCEQRLGPLLQPDREDLFLSCKTTQRTREGAAFELKRSLERLHTDYFDLYQLHGLRDMENDLDVAFAKGGAMEVLIDAKRRGRVRHLGFSAHSEEVALEALDRYEFDSVLFPFNWACWLGNGFGRRLYGKASEEGVTLLALKALAREKWPEEDGRRQQYAKCWYKPVTEREEAELALRFTLNLPVTAAIPPGEEGLFTMALDIACNLRPLSDSETETLRALSREVSAIFPQ